MSKNMNKNVRDILSQRMVDEQARIEESDKLTPTYQMKEKATKVVATTLLVSSIAGSATPAFADNRLNESKYKGEGFISVTEEVGANGTGGKISSGKGDRGGVSYGLTQLSTETGSAKTFVYEHLKNNHPEFYAFFKDAGEPGTDKFNTAWTNAYNYNPGQFEDIQLEFKEKEFVNPAQKMIMDELGIDMFATRARVELLHSSSVQFGPTGMKNLLINAGANKNMSEKELLTTICDYKINNTSKLFKSSSKDHQVSIKERFKREKDKLIEIVNEEQGLSLEDVLEGKRAIVEDKTDEIVGTAKSYLNQGTTYKMGGKDTNKLDCSGYVSLVYQDLGLDIDEMMTNAGKFRQDSTEITRDELKEGDLVFWHDLTGRKHAKVFHIGIYVGNDTVVDCSIDHNGVGTRKLSSLQDKEGDRYFTFGRYEGVNNVKETIEISEEEEFSDVIIVEESIKQEVAEVDNILNQESENEGNNPDMNDEPQYEEEEENSIIGTTPDEEDSNDEGDNSNVDDEPQYEEEEENSIIGTTPDEEDSNDEGDEENSTVDTDSNENQKDDVDNGDLSTDDKKETLEQNTDNNGDNTENSKTDENVDSEEPTQDNTDNSINKDDSISNKYQLVSAEDTRIQEIKSNLENNMFGKIAKLFS